MKHMFQICCTIALVMMLTLCSEAQMDRRSLTVKNLPSAVVANMGQWNGKILFGDMLGRYAFTREGVIYAKPGSSDKLTNIEVTDVPVTNTRYSMLCFVNASANMRIRSGSSPAGLGNLYSGGDSTKWLSRLPMISNVTYENVWDSVDAEIVPGSESLRLLLHMRPGADVGRIGIDYENGELIHGNDTGIHGEKNGSPELLLCRDTTVRLTRISRDSGTHVYEYTICFGGSETDYVSSVRASDDGTLYVCGYTSSSDFRVTGNRRGIYVMHLDCGIRDALYCTIYCVNKDNIDVFPQESDSNIPMCLRRNGNVIASGRLDIRDSTLIPLTGNALENSFGEKFATAFFFELDQVGQLKYASLLGGGPGPDFGSFIRSMTTDANDYLLIHGHFCNHFLYFTAGTIDHRDSDVGEFLVKLTPSLEAVVWGTRIGPYPYCLGDHRAVAVDHMGNVIVIGEFSSFNGSSIPLVNAAVTYPQDHGMYMQKITPQADSIIFSTYLGGQIAQSPSRNEYCYMANPVIGSDNSIHICGHAAYQTFPIVGSSRSFQGQADGFYMNLSPTGQIKQSFVFGGRFNDMFIDLAFDKAGNLYALGTTRSRDFPLSNSRYQWRIEDSARATLTIFKNGTDSVLFSSLLDLDNYWDVTHSSTNTTSIHVGSTGYVTIGSSVERPLHSGTPLDSYLTRLYLPFAGQDFLRTTVIVPDSLRLETTKDIIIGSRFPVRVTVDNPSVKDTAYNTDLILKLPAGISLDPPSQSFVHHCLSPLLPGAHEEFVWNVRVDRISSVDSVFSTHAIAEYDLEPNPPSCERPFVRGTGYVPVHRYESPKPIYTCIIEAPDTLSVTADSLTNNPFPVRCHIHNTGQSTFTLYGLRLVLPTGSPAALELVPAGDSLRPGGTLAPGEEMVRDWTVKALYFPNTYERVIKLMVIDTFGYRLPGCEKIVAIPGLKRTACTITATDTVSYNASQGMYLPSPLNVDLTITSDLDTALAGVTARLDFVHASHLRLVTGDSSNRSLPSISAHGSMGARWRLEVVPHPSGPVSDTLFVYHHAPGWTEERWCMHVIRIIPPVKDVSCSLGAPAVAVTATNTYSPDTAVVKWIVMNNGAIAVSGLTAHLDISCDPSWCLDAQDRSVGIVQSSGQDSVTWRLVPKTSAFERDISLRVTARDSLGTEITSCDVVLQLPRIYPPLRCSLACPDTLHYMSQTDSYDPDPFNATVTVENLVDTAMIASAQLDLSGASHLKLAPSETGQATLGIVQPHGVVQHSFSVAVSTPAGQMSSENIAVNAEGLFGGTQFESICATSTIMQPRPSIHTAEYFTAGHDTVWSDPVHEDIIPHPIQIRNGIINTGNDPLENCEAAIIVPDGYILTQPPDSIQKYAPIAPGDTGRKEWLLEVNRNSPTPDPRTVRFVWHCDSGVQGECTRDVVLKASSPQGLVLSKWRLQFSAEMNMAIPASQKVSVWTGGNAPFAWQSVPDVTWLSATPSVLGGSGTIDIVPTTTAMSVGTYEGKVSIVTSEYARPEPIEVGYEIWIKSDAKPLPTPSGMWLECVPNPARPGGILHIRYSVDKPGSVRIRLMDALGREVNSEYREAFSTAEQQTTLSLPSTLVSGAYFIVLERAAGRIVKGVVVR